MGRGKTVDIWDYVANIKPYLEKGATVRDACVSAGIPYETVRDYIKADEKVRLKIKSYEGLSIWEARKTLAKGIKKDPDLALKYLERKRKSEFSTKTENENVTYNRFENVKAAGKELRYDFGKSAGELDEDEDPGEDD